MKAMKAQKAMKANKTGATTTARGLQKLDGVDYAAIGEQTGVHPMDVRKIIDGLMGLAATELANAWTFKIANMLNSKLKVHTFLPNTHGRNPETKERWRYARGCEKTTIKAYPTKQLKGLIK